jgi:hypothetical protein
MCAYTYIYIYETADLNNIYRAVILVCIISGYTDSDIL